MHLIDAPSRNVRTEVLVNKKILLAEDETDLRKMMKILLEIHGFQVIEAADGYEAVEKAVSESPDLILMDMAMPMMGGVESTQKIRRHDALAETPIVAVTAYGDLYDARARAAGCNDVIRKPLDFAQLKPMVERYIA
jgi:CheY-like chemotaxis protein